MMVKKILAFLTPLLLLVLQTSATLVRVVTWNVHDNSDMSDGFSDVAIDKVLGLNENGTLPDIYAIGLQEVCWYCNYGNFYLIGNKFLDRISEKDPNYKVIHIEGTRESIWCQAGCTFGTHGSTILVVIAKKNLVKNNIGFHHNDYCSDTTPQNDEKGIAGIQLKLNDGKSVCFANAHLEPGSADTRRKCAKLFYEDAKQYWKLPCDYDFLFGDFNTRTGDKDYSKPTKGKGLSQSDPILKVLKTKDEFSGRKPYGKTKFWGQSFLDYLVEAQIGYFNEPKVNFMPTYSIRPSKECHGNIFCYKQDRPPSWTDRIVLTKGHVLKYNSITENYSDHFAVYGVYRLD